MNGPLEGKEYCIILRNINKSDQTFSVLTKTRGKVVVHVRAQKSFQHFVVGTFFCAQFQNKGKNWQASSIEILMHPPINMYPHLRLFHNVLEICYYFIEPHNPGETLFKVVYQALIFFSHYRSIGHHFVFLSRIYLVKLFKEIGFYPPERLVWALHIFDQLVVASIDLSDRRNVSLVKRECARYCPQDILLVDGWIETCIKRHPQHHLFKTRFVLESAVNH